MKRNNQTCSLCRILGNGGMAAGFLLLCLSVGLMEQETGAAGPVLALLGGGVFASAFLEKLFFWRCPHCGCHLTLCAGRTEKNCPCCGAPVKNK